MFISSFDIPKPWYCDWEDENEWEIYACWHDNKLQMSFTEDGNIMCTKKIDDKASVSIFKGDDRTDVESFLEGLF